MSRSALPKRPPEDFDWILLQFNKKKLTPTIVAGQAVNIWGKAFREWDAKFNPYSPKIDDLLPLSSDDLEILETTDVKAISKFKGVRFVDKAKPSSRVRSADAATLWFENEKGRLKVQVMSWVIGADNEEIERRSIPVRLGDSQVEVKVPDPIVLLKCKIANLVRLNQDDPPRQDLKHIKILICCVHAFIGHFVQSESDPRPALKLINRLRRLARTHYAKQVGEKYHLDWDRCIPMEVIRQLAKDSPKWERFLRQKP